MNQLRISRVPMGTDPERSQIPVKRPAERRDLDTCEPVNSVNIVLAAAVTVVAQNNFFSIR